MHTPLEGVNTPSFCMTPPSFGELGGVLGGVSASGGCSWVVAQPAQGIRGVFREVVSTEFGLRTYSPIVCLHKHVVQPSQNQC
jgi:hypothetical protein